MKQEEIDQKIKELVLARAKRASEKMKNLPKCQDIFVEMTKQGYVEEMNCFRNIIFFSAMLHPEWTDEELIENFYRELVK